MLLSYGGSVHMWKTLCLLWGSVHMWKTLCLLLGSVHMWKTLCLKDISCVAVGMVPTARSATSGPYPR